MSCTNCNPTESPVKRLDVTVQPYDFWRDLTGNLPDATNDHTEPITHNGPVVVGGITATTGKVLTVWGDVDISGQIDPNSLVFSDAPAGVTSAWDSVTQNYYKIGVIGTQRPLVLMPITDATNAVQARKANGATVVLDVDTLNGRIGINAATPQAALDVSGAAILRSVAVADLTANATLTASATVDVASVLSFAQATTGITATLPTPTQATAGRVLICENGGTQSITVNTTPIAPGKLGLFIWAGAAWRELLAGGGGSSDDFWRSGTGATKPDGATDTTENIGRAGNVGIGLSDPSTVAARLDVAGAEILRPVLIANKTANGALGLATATVDVTSNVQLAQTTANIALTLPTPTNAQAGRLLLVENTGTVATTVGGQSIAAGTGVPFIWSGTTWIPLGISPADFWRSGVGATTLPDNTTDLTENIRRNGFVGLSADPVAMLDVNGAEILRPVTLANFGANGPVGTAAATVDVASTLIIPQTTGNVSLTLPNPTNAQAGRRLFVLNTGTEDFIVSSSAGIQKVFSGGLIALVWNGSAWTPAKHAPYVVPIQFNGNLTLQAVAHHFEILHSTSAVNVTVVVPASLPVGFQVSLTQGGAGRIIFATSGGMVLDNRWAASMSAGTWAKIGIECDAVNHCILSGDVV